MRAFTTTQQSVCALSCKEIHILWLLSTWSISWPSPSSPNKQSMIYTSLLYCIWILWIQERPTLWPVVCKSKKATNSSASIFLGKLGHPHHARRTFPQSTDESFEQVLFLQWDHSNRLHCLVLIYCIYQDSAWRLWHALDRHISRYEELLSFRSKVHLCLYTEFFESGNDFRSPKKWFM